MHHLHGAMQYRQTPWAIFLAIFTKLGMGRVSQVRSLTPNFTVNFWYNFAKKGNTLNRFLQIWHGEGLPGSHPYAKFYRFGWLNVGLRPKKSPKMVIFGINFPQRGIP